MQEDDIGEAPGEADVPADSKGAAGDALASSYSGGDLPKGLEPSTEAGGEAGGAKKLRDVAKGAIFREVVLAKVREVKEQERALEVEKAANEKEAKRKSFGG